MCSYQLSAQFPLLKTHTNTARHKAVKEGRGRRQWRRVKDAGRRLQIRADRWPNGSQDRRAGKVQKGAQHPSDVRVQYTPRRTFTAANSSEHIRRSYIQCRGRAQKAFGALHPMLNRDYADAAEFDEFRSIMRSFSGARRNDSRPVLVDRLGGNPLSSSGVSSGTARPRGRASRRRQIRGAEPVHLWTVNN